MLYSAKRGSPTKSIALSSKITLKTFTKAYTSDLISKLLAKGQACPTSSGQNATCTVERVLIALFNDCVLVKLRWTTSYRTVEYVHVYVCESINCGMDQCVLTVAVVYGG